MICDLPIWKESSGSRMGRNERDDNKIITGEYIMVNTKFITILKTMILLSSYIRYNYAIYIKAWKSSKLYSSRTVSFI